MKASYKLKYNITYKNLKKFYIITINTNYYTKNCKIL